MANRLIRRGRRERGIAVVAAMYGLSVFSVLALTMLTDSKLEEKMRTAQDRDLHVVLFAGGAGSEMIVSRLNLPTVSRELSKRKDFGVEVKAPALSGVDLRGDFSEGWTYAVELGRDMTVCCDGGDGACEHAGSDHVISGGSVNRSVDVSRVNHESTKRLFFDLSAFPPPGNLVLDPSTEKAGGFGIKATRVLLPTDLKTEGDAQAAGAAMSCSLQANGITLATGKLRPQPTTDAQTSGANTATIELSYHPVHKK